MIERWYCFVSFFLYFTSIIKLLHNKNRRWTTNARLLYQWIVRIETKRIVITKLSTENKIRHVYLALELREPLCPECGCKTSVVHDYRVRIIKHQCGTGYHDIIH